MARIFPRYEHSDEMVDKFRMRCTSTQLTEPLVHCAPNGHECNVPLQHRPPLPKLDIFAVDADEEPPEEWEAEDDVKGTPLDPREVKTAREIEIKYLRDMEVYGTQTSWPQVDRY